MEIEFPPDAAPKSTAPLFGSRRRDLVIIGLVALVMLAGGCARCLVYYRHTLVVMRYQGVDAKGGIIELHPQGEHADFVLGREPRDVVQRRAEGFAKGYAKRLARDRALQARGIVEVRWSLRSGPHRNRLKDVKKGRVKVKAKVPAAAEVPPI